MSGVGTRILEYSEPQIEAVRQFNDRLKAGGAANRFPLSPVPAWLPHSADRRLFQEYFVAADGDGAVRGAYILKHQEFWVRDRVVSLADFQLPISEGIVDRRYSPVAVQLLRDALARQSLLFGLGMGGYDQAVARLLVAAGWRIWPVPFLFRIVHPPRFLHNIAFLRRSRPRAVALDALAYTGVGWAGVHAVQRFCRPKPPRDPSIVADPVTEFGDWADLLWEACRTGYGMCAVRDAEVLRILYPGGNEKFIRLKVMRREKCIGWAVCLDTQLAGHRQFGNLRLGSLVDCFAAPEDGAAVAVAAREVLEKRDVDLIVSNQAHAAWLSALRMAGFLSGPSNFLLTISPGLTQVLKAARVEDRDVHINRGDGDGPINL
jgi:hypothetical protein